MNGEMSKQKALICKTERNMHNYEYIRANVYAYAYLHVHLCFGGTSDFRQIVVTCTQVKLNKLCGRRKGCCTKGYHRKNVSIRNLHHSDKNKILDAKKKI